MKAEAERISSKNEDLMKDGKRDGMTPLEIISSESENGVSLTCVLEQN